MWNELISWWYEIEKFFSSIYMPRKQRKMIWHYILLFHSSAIPIQKNFSQSFWRFMNEYSSAKILMAWPFEVKKKAARVWFQCYNFVGKNVLAGVFAAILKRRWSYFRDICTINIKSLIERQCPKRLNSMHFKSTGFNINKDGPKRMKSLMIDDKCSLKNERFWQYWKICQYTIDGWKETDFIDENGWLSHTLLFHTCKLRRRKIHLITFTQFFIE